MPNSFGIGQTVRRGHDSSEVRCYYEEEKKKRTPKLFRKLTRERAEHFVKLEAAMLHLSERSTFAVHTPMRACDYVHPQTFAAPHPPGVRVIHPSTHQKEFKYKKYTF